MKTKDVINHFGGVRETAKALGLTTQAIYAWGETVPPSRHSHVTLATKGRVKPEKTVHGAKS